jgi:predicted kinase
MAGTLVVLGGLPGSGKTTIARELAAQLGATHLRIDSIEQAIRDAGLAGDDLDDAGYRMAYSRAANDLQVGRTVIADSVNPLAVTRDAWLDVAKRAQARVLEIEILCSDAGVHRSRVESRVSDLPGLKLPSWDDVIRREYERWHREHVIVDTARRSPAECVDQIRAALSKAW